MPTPSSNTTHNTGSRAIVPGLRERKKARTKATIQREALRLFSRQGYAATSVEQIAEAAEISPSTYFRYFATKDDVVLADFVDGRAIARILEAPAELSPVAALRHAMTEVVGSMDEEELELERLRNELIRTVPELRPGLLREMLRPTQLLTDTFAERLGRDPGDPDLRLFCAALIGAMVLSVDDAESAEHDMGEVLPGVLERAERLERMLVLPPAT